VTHPFAIVAAKTVTLLLGGLITYLSYRAYRRTGARPLRALAVGFAIITTGAALGGAIDLLTSADVLTGILVNSVLTMVGFGFIVYSLYTD
jgi:xanthine/uracil permease